MSDAIAKCMKVQSPASKAGQLIGEAFEQAVIRKLQQHLIQHHRDYELLAPDDGKQVLRLTACDGEYYF